MTNGPESTGYQEFQDRLQAAVREVRQYTRHGVDTIIEDIQSIGGLQVAKKRLCIRNHASLHSAFNLPSVV